MRRIGLVTVVAHRPHPFQPVELADARWVSRSDVLRMLEGTHPVIGPPRSGAIAGALIEAWAHGRLLDADYWNN